MSTTIEQLKPIKFDRKIGKDFASTLKKRVRDYFKENNISKYANTSMVLKTIFMISLYLVPYILMLVFKYENPWMVVLTYTIMGFGIAGIGLSIMHDANHGAYSKNEKVNFWVGRVVNLVGGFAPTWKIQHNVLHHTYTNVFGYDEDVSPAIPILRFSPDDKKLPIHRFQYIYAWFFYSLMTFMWITTKDFQQLFRYKKMGLTKTESKNFNALLIELIIAKVGYYILFLVIPILLLSVSWWVIVLSLILSHLIAGLILAAIFQPAHVVPETEFPHADKDLKIENNFLIHQLETTTNYAPQSKIFYWLVGGLNYQIEHHLFPNICHVHYKGLSKVVKQTAEEFNVPYHSHKTFFSAIKYHTKMLKDLGK